MKAIINARIYDYNRYIENGYLLYDEKIEKCGPMSEFPKGSYEKVEDYKGDLLMPTFVCAHAHIYSIFARGLALPFNPKNFQQILDQMWWKIDAKLVNEETYYSAICAGSEFLLNGVTAVIDHHASGEILGSLKSLRKAFVGPLKMHGIFCFETSDRYDVSKCIRENKNFAKRYPGEGLFGLHASMSLSNATLRKVARAQGDVPVHVHVAESLDDEVDSEERYNKPIIKRFDEYGLLKPNSLIVHGVHLKDGELQIIKDRKCYMVVNTTSNMNNAVGVPNVRKYLDYGIPVMVGNDGLSSNMANEYNNVLYTGHLRTLSPIGIGLGDVHKMIENAYEYVGNRLGIKLGKFEKNYEADFMRVKYSPFTKMDESNAFGHLFYGLFPALKPSDVYTAGVKRVKDYKITSKKLVNQVIEARKFANNLWSKVKED